MPIGPQECTAGARAFTARRHRIRRHILERTDMLASGGHHVRTPLTRMKLQRSLMPPGAEAEELTGDVEEMEKMVGAYLAFARGQSEQPAEPTELGGLIHELAVDVRGRGRELQGELPEAVALPLRLLSFNRAPIGTEPRREKEW